MAARAIFRSSRANKLLERIESASRPRPLNSSVELNRFAVVW